MNSDWGIQVEPNCGGARLRGTDISVYLIAVLHPKNSIDEILEDYPSLSRTQVVAAIAYAEANPQQSNTHPSRTFKRGLGDLVNLGVFD